MEAPPTFWKARLLASSVDLEILSFYPGVSIERLVIFLPERLEDFRQLRLAREIESTESNFGRAKVLAKEIDHLRRRKGVIEQSFLPGKLNV